MNDTTDCEAQEVEPSTLGGEKTVIESSSDQKEKLKKPRRAKKDKEENLKATDCGENTPAEQEDGETEGRDNDKKNPRESQRDLPISKGAKGKDCNINPGIQREDPVAIETSGAQVAVNDGAAVGNAQDPSGGSAVQNATSTENCGEKCNLNSICRVLFAFLAGIFIVPVIVFALVCAQRKMCCRTNVSEQVSGPEPSPGQGQGRNGQEPPKSQVLEPEPSSGQGQGQKGKDPPTPRLEIIANILGALLSVVTIISTCLTLIPQEQGIEVIPHVETGSASPFNSEPIALFARVKRVDNNEPIKGLGMDNFMIESFQDNSFVVCEFEGCFLPGAFYKFKIVRTDEGNWLDKLHNGFLEVKTKFGTEELKFDFRLQAPRDTAHPSAAPSSDPSSNPTSLVEAVGATTVPSISTCSDDPCFPGVSCTNLTDGGFACDACPPDFKGDGVTCERFRELFDQPMSVVHGSDEPRRIWADSEKAEVINVIEFCAQNGYNDIEDFAKHCAQESDISFLDWNVLGQAWQVRDSDVTKECYELIHSVTCLNVDFELPSCSTNPCFPGVDCSNLPQGGFECGGCPADFHGNGIHCVRIREVFELPTAKISNDSEPQRIWADSFNSKHRNGVGFCRERMQGDVENFGVACDGQPGSDYLDWNPYDRMWETRRINVTNETLDTFNVTNEKFDTCYDLFQSIACVNISKNSPQPGPQSGTDSADGSMAESSIVILVLVVTVVVVGALALAFVACRARRRRLEEPLEPSLNLLLPDDEKPDVALAVDIISFAQDTVAECGSACAQDSVPQHNDAQLNVPKGSPTEDITN